MKKVTLFTSLFLFFLQYSYSQPGELDSSFGSNGIITTDLGTNYNGTFGNSLSATSTGDLYLVAGLYGSSYINKFRSNGFLDSNYGKNGFSGFVSFNTRKAELQADGKVVLVGTTDNSRNWVVARFNTDGNLDNTFGLKGIRSTNFGTQVNIANAAAIQPDGKIVVAGEISFYSNEVEYTHFAIVRYNTDGSPDSTFSKDGMETNDSIGGAYSLQIQSDGKIIAVTNSAIAHFNSDGSLDKTYGSNGKRFIDYNTLSTFQTDGKILAIGQAGSYPNIDFGINRYNADGTLDTSFSGDGKVTTDINGNFDQAQSVIVQVDGKIVVGGFSGNDTTSNFVLVRYNKDGTLDSSFGMNGVQITKATPGFNGINSMAVSNNKLYASGSGYSSNGSFPHILGILARYLLDDKNKVVPTISLSGPVNNASFPAPANIHLVAAVTDPGSRVSKVEFYNNKRLIGTADSFPYIFTWPKVRLGNYSLTAKAIYDTGHEVTSDTVHITVVPNKYPGVSITKPVNNQSFTAPANIRLEAAASDTDGRITRVEFYKDATLLRTEYKYPYTYNWSNVPPGTYTVTAVATDNWGAQTTSAPVIVTVTSDSTIVSSRPYSENKKTALNDASSLRLSPNPASDILNIYTSGLQQNKPTTLSIISVSGIVLKTMRISNAATQLDVSSLASGVYTIKMVSGDKVMYNQFVKL